MRKAYKTVACLLAGTVLLTGAGLPNKVQAAGIETNEFAYLAGAPVENSLESKISASQEITQEKADTVKAINTVEDTIGTSLDNAAVSNVENYTEIKAAADDNSEVVGKLYNQSLAIITENPNNGWYKIHSGSVDGYVKAETLTVGDVNAIQATSYQTADVMTDSLKVRSEMSTESGVVTMVDTGSKLSVLGEADGWVAVSTAAGNGYVSAEYVQVTTQYKQAISRAEEEEAARQAEEAARKAEEEKKKQAGSNVISYGSQFVGNPYVWGGSSLTNGADCSGFVMSVYAHFGISLPHSSAALRGVGRPVDISDIQPGDIVCYEGHVGLYAGNGRLLHASNKKDGIKISSSITYRKIVAIRRVL